MTAISREHVRHVVLSQLERAVDDIDPDTVDTSWSMKELGANSLDIVEVVSCAMRELRVKVPRSELNTIANIDGLVDLLLQAAVDKAAQHTSA